MKILLVTLRKRAGSDDVSRRETLIEGTGIRIGRGVAMEVNLADIDVDFHHATLTDGGGYLSLRAVGENGLTVGKRQQSEVALQPGVEAQISRYTFKGEAGRDGADHVLIMEEAPDTGATDKKRSGSKRRLEEVLPSRRTLSWVLSLVILGLFVAWPMSEVLTRPAPAEGPVVVDGMARVDIPSPSIMESSWSSGPISTAHLMIEDDCGACHQRPFEMTTNNACLACHAETANHTDTVKHPSMALENTRCASCHKEHNGGETPTAIANAACASCHADIKSVSEKSNLQNITGFAIDHPAFSLALMLPPEEQPDGTFKMNVERTLFDPQNPPTEGSGLKFPHAKHLSVEGVETGNGKRQLGCSDCHQQQAEGRLMRPMNMERDCSGCHAHKLQFDAAGTVREIPHADAAEAERVVRDYFIAAALAGDVVLEDDPDDQGAASGSGEQNANKPKRKRRRIAGQTDAKAKAASLSGADRQAAIQWATDEAKLRVDTIFKTQLCGNCHETQQLQTEGLSQRWRVKPAFIQHNWMPRARFDHNPHAAMDCTGCHAATTSTQASDVLMPGIKNCQGCHQGEEQAGAAASACVDCHDYHVPGRTPMSPAHAEIAEKRRLERQQAQKTQ